LRRLALALAAASAGASGLALETLLLDCAGLGLGHGRSTAFGLATFIAAWALGAHRAGRSRRSPRLDLFAAGGSVALVACPAVWIVLAGGRAPGSIPSVVSTVLAIAAAAFCQGLFLAPLARAFSGAVAWLLAANLGGAVVGAGWIADRIVGGEGRLAAALAAGACGLAAGVLGGSAAGAVPPAASARPSEEAEISWRSAAWIVGACTAWIVSLEWIGLRLGVLWLGGMQPALRAVLTASMISLAVGAALVPWIAPRGSAGILWTLGLGSVGAVWPVIAGSALHWLGLDARTAVQGDLRIALVLVLPALAPFGGLLAVLHRALPRETGERLGRLLLHEASGALLGVPFVQLALLPAVGLGATVALLETCGLLSILSLARARPRAAGAAALLPLSLGAWSLFRPPPALASPPLSNPAFRILSFAEDRDFAVTVVDDGIQGERTLLTDGFRAAGTGREYRYMQVLGHLPVLLSAHPRRVAVLALGTGTTVGAVALHPEVERIDVLEISRAVVEAAPWFLEKNRGALAEERARVVVRLGDGRATLAQERQAFDVITMEPLLPDSPFGVYLYTREFYERARVALAPGGLVCQWVPPHALEPESFDAVLDAFARAFPWSSIWLSGTQAILIGAEEEPRLAPDRFSSEGELAESLAELGLATPAQLVSHFVADGARVPRVPRGSRELRDRDPWIVYRTRRTGAVLLGDLPGNLARLRSIASPPPAAWLSAAGAEARRELDGRAALRAAREAYALAEARLRGWSGGSGPEPSLDASFAQARSLLQRDPEVDDLASEIAFNADLRAGVSALGADRSPERARGALPSLLSAVRGRPRRGDVHLYLAAALERAGDRAAEAEIDAALAVCPRIARTAEGRRARSLGLSEASWSRLEAAADEEERRFFTNKRFEKSSGVVTSDSP
jgi:spermidine synthase